MISKTTHQNFAFKFLVSKASRRILLLLFLCITNIALSQIGSQSPSIDSGVTFQWEDTQNGNNDNPATIESITINGEVYPTFAVPSGYQLTRLGRGPGNHSENHVMLNGTQTIGTSATATMDITDSTPWDDEAKAAFQSKNLNYYFESNPTGRSICLDFDKANGINGEQETDSQMQTLFYNPPIPSNDGGILAVTERGGNNCLYVRFFGIPAGGGPEQPLGDTFVRTSGNLTGGGFSAPASGSDYWGSGREQDNGQTIAIGLFHLNSVAPTGSLITKVRFLAASNDHGDGKVFILQKYAVDQTGMGCVDEPINGNLNDGNNVPANSTYTLSGPPPAGQSFTLNTDGTYTYVPNPGFTGTVAFDYEVCLPAPNQAICGTATVTLTVNPNPDEATAEFTCGNTPNSGVLNITAPTGGQYKYALDNGNFQSSTQFNNIGAGTYIIKVKNTNTNCISEVSYIVEDDDNDAPVAFGEEFSTGINQSITFNVLDDNGNGVDFDPDGDPFTIISNTQPGNGSIVNNGNGSFTFTPSTGFVGSTFFTYTIEDDPFPCENLEETDTATVTIQVVSDPEPRDCNCSPLYKNSNFVNPQLISGQALEVGAVYRFADVFPSNPHGTTLDALVRIEEFAGGASLLEIDVTSSGLPEAFQPRINSTNNNDQSVLFSITFVESGGNYGNEVEISFYGTPLDIDGDNVSTREYAELSLPDAYFVSNNTFLDITQTATEIRGESTTINVAPGDDVSLDPRYTYSNYWQTKSSLTYRIGKLDGNSDRYYSFNVSCADYDDPDAVFITNPVICGNVSDEQGNPLANVTIDITGSDGSSETVTTDANGDYKKEVVIPDPLSEVVFEIVENDLPGYISISDVDGANDNLITRTISLESSCGNDFVDGFEVVLELDNKTDILCNGDNTGSITVTASGGVPPYTYTLNGGTPQASATFDNLVAGNYTIEVTDSLGNTDSLVVNLTQPEPINIEITKTNAAATSLCNNGTATATASGGVGPYTYQWNDPNNQTTATATGLYGDPIGGTQYTVTITDENGCTSQQSVVINCVQDCDAVISVDDITDVLCKGDDTGSATVSASSQANPNATFTFTWNTVPPQVDTGVTSSTLSDLTTGVYTVSVTIDGTLCAPVEESITINEPSTAVSVTATSTDESGPTTGDGTATANPSGGTPPYTYSWSPGGEITQTITGLSAGDYTVTVTDANGCMATATTTVNPGTCQNLAIQASSTPVTCNGDADGTATANVTGGSGNFSYAWSPGGETTQSISNLTAGTYTVTVTDNVTLCTATASTTVNQPAALSTGIAVTDVSCFGENTGSLDLTVNGGTQPYTFAWSNGATTEDITNLPAGTYSVTVTDANGCTISDSATIDQPAEAVALQITTQTDIVCTGLGSVTVDASGGTAPYAYSLDGGTAQASGTFDNLDAGTYTISVSDANLCTESIQVTILENCTDAIPDINDTPIDTAVSGNVLTNDEDYEGDNQTVTTTGTFTTAQGGTVQINADGSYTYTPPAGFVGEDTFDYSIEDDGNPQATDSTTVTIEVISVQNNSTIANNDTASTEINTNVQGNVLVNDFDPENDTITVTTTGSITTDQGGTIVFNADGSFDYTPPTDFVGEDTVTYSITDDNTNPATDSAVLTITVLDDPAENYTFANDDAYFGNAGATINGNVLDNDSDPEGDIQAVNTTPVTGPTNGTVTLNSDGTFEYVPNDPAFQGTDSFVYSVCDNGTPQACDEATVYITLFNENTTDAIDDINDTLVDMDVSGNVLTNDEDLQGDNQVVTTTGTITTAQGGSVVLNADGSYTYSPPAGFTGTDTFEYSIEDDGNPVATDTATVTIEVRDGNGGNTTIANNDTATTSVGEPVDGNVLVNDIDLEGDAQVVTTVGTFTTDQGGSITIDSDGNFTYTPPAGFTGEDTFTYSIEDNGTPVATDDAVLTITVNPVGLPNTTDANDDAYSGNQGATITGNVLDNDNDQQGDLQQVDTAVTPVSGPSNGTLTINADGTFTYVPNDPNFQGTDQFVYEIFDDGTPEARDQATVLITIFGQNTTDAIDDINDTLVDVPVAGNVLTNDEDAQGDAQTVTTTGTYATVEGGSVTMAADGSYTYTPPAGFTGTDSFEYTIVDDGNPQATDTATVTIEVRDGNGDNTTIANNDIAGTEVDTPVDGNVLVNDIDLEGDAQQVTTVGTFTTDQGGNITIDADGNFTYTPPAGFTGEDTFTYSIVDDNANPATDSAVLTITVDGNPGNNQTYANDDAYAGNAGGTITGNVSDNDSDPEGDTQTVNTTPVSGPSNGTVTLNPDGSFSYVPNDPTYQGPDQFVYEVCDDGTPQACDQATVYITIFGENTTDAIDDINDTLVDMDVSGNVLTNDEDLQGDNQVVTTTGTITTAQGGSVVLNADGSYTYSPPAGFTGTDTFEYSIEDDGNPVATDTATVTIEVRDGNGGNTTIANNDTATTSVGEPVDGNVLVNDIDLEGDAQVVTTVGTFTTDQGGSITIDSDGNFTYTPPAGFTGEDTFTYSIEDNGAPVATDDAVLTITVNPVGLPNTTDANDDAYSGNQGATITGNVLDNDNDQQGDLQQVDTAVTPVSGPSNGTLTINADGTFTYVPNDPNFQGTDQFVYEIFDDGTPEARDQATVLITIFGQNTTDAVLDINNTYIDTAVSGNVLTNDEDIQGDAQTVTTAGTFPTTEGGSIVIAADGNYTYTPPAGFVGEDTFEYAIIDDGNPQATDTAIIYIEVLPIGTSGNEPPIANDDTASTEVDTPVTGNVLVNDFDQDGDPITVTTPTVVTDQGVTVTIDPTTGVYTYTPPTGFEGVDTFTYTICDDGNPQLCDDAIVEITVVGNSEENNTFANDDAYNGYPGETISGNVSDNDSDPEGDNQIVNTTPVSGPSNGTLTLNPDGTFDYMPNDPTFVGTDQFVYSVCDDGTPQACDEATVYITIGEFNNEILAIDDINDTFVGLPVDGDVGTNDINEDGPAGTETFTLVNGPTAGGALVFNPDGTYTYTPPADPTITEDTFEYQVCDAGNPIACDTAIVYIEIQPVGSPDNEPPVANADTNSTQVNIPVDGTVIPNDFDPDGDPIVVTGNTDPANGDVTVNPDGTYTYTPDPGFTGEDTFEYTICDNGTPALCDTATVTIQVLDTQDNITTAVDDAYYGFPDTDITGNVLDNDTDPEGDDQTVDVAISPSNGPSNGTVVLNADGSFTYTPGAGFTGTDSFVYEIFDDNAMEARDVATVYISINPSGAGNEILAIDDINDTFVNLPVSGSVATNDLNVDGPVGTETFTLVSGPNNGMLTFNPDGSYTYTPGLDYVGEDTFEYQVCDAGNPIACDTAIVYIEIQPVGSPDNEPPVANADTNSTQADTPVDGTVIPNDFDPDGDPIVVTGNTDPANGDVTVNPDGTYTYTPDPGFTGEDTFEYTICDNGTPALCDTATVTIQILDTQDNITTAVDDAYYGFPDTDITGNVLDNDTDPEGDDQTVDVAISPSNGPSNGTVVLNADGSFTYTPGAGFTGTDSFVYEIFDDNATQARDVATVYISIAAGGNEILAIDDINDTFVGLPVDGDVGTNDINEDGPAGTETFTLVNGPTAGGALVFNPDGTYTYTPPADPTITEDTFEYQVCDAGNPIACDTAIVYIEIQPVGSPDNEPPVANADTNSTQVNIPVDGTVIPNDFDPDGDPIVVTGNTDPANGDVTVNPDGTYTYTPDPGFTGEDTFEYTICDNGTPALCDTATVTIQILDTQDNITTAVDDAYYGFPDTDITGNVLDNDTDPEGDDQTVDVAISPSNGPSNGTVVLNADGSFTYTPGAGFTGTDSFVYEIFDDNATQARDIATVYISIAEPGNEILAVDDINDTFVNLPVSGSVATNDENYDGPAGTEVFTLVSGPTAGGTLTFNPDGTYDYTPANDYVGDDTFVYQICDGGNPVACDTANVTITIVDDPIIGNDPPVAINDVNITEIDIPVDGNVLVNDFDPDTGDTISVTANTDPTNGTVTVAPNGDYTYTPNPGFEGIDTFEYTICDSATPALCDTAIVTIYVIGDPGNITVANDDAYYGEIDTPVTGNVLDNDSDPEGNNQTLDVGTTPVEGPFNGTVMVNVDGSFTYTPAAGFTGNDRFVYEIFDNGSPVATDQATVYILIEETPAPAIAIVKSGVFIDGNGDACADVDEVIRYTFTVTNEGNVPLDNITVTDPLLEAPNPVVAITFVDGDTNGNGLLDTDESWTYTADYALTQDDIDLGNVTNQATVEGTDEDGTTVSDLSDESLTTEDDPTVTDVCQSPAIAIVKEASYDDGGDCSQPGEMIDYTFFVTNEGNVSLSSITVTDQLLGGNVPGPISGDTDGDNELDVDETWLYNGTYNITQDDIDAGEVNNQATAEGTAPDGTVVDDLSGDTILTDTTTTTTLCQSPVIAIVKDGTLNDNNQSGCSDAGIDTISYVFTVTNEGNVSLTNVTVTDPLLEAPNPVVPIVFAGGDTDGDNELDIDETWTYTADYTLTQDDIDAGNVTNQATATGTGGGTTVSDLSDESLTTEDDPTVTDVCQSPVIAIVKDGTLNDNNQSGCSDAGIDTISYVFTVTNEGNVSLTNVTVTDPLLEAPNPVVPIVFAGGDTDGDNELDIDETWTYTADYTLTQDDIDAGNVTNQATATGTGGGTTVSDLSDDSLTTEDDPTVTDVCQSPVIAIVKDGELNDNNQSGCSDAGIDTISYTFVVTNEGNVSLTGVTVTDPLLEAPNPVVPIVFAGGDTDGDNELDIDETWTYTAEYTLTQDDIDAGNVTNQATATGTGGGTTVSDLSDDSLTTEDDPTVTDVCQDAEIAIVKEAVYDDGGDCTQPGEMIDYTFTVTNEGTVSLANIVVTDPLLEAPNPVVPIIFVGGDTDGDTELDVTETWVYTASYTIVQADIDAGQVNNQATAQGTTPDGSIVDDLSGPTVEVDEITTTDLCQEPSIAVIKIGTLNDENGNGCSDVKETISYEFQVMNTGNVTLTQVDIDDPLVNVVGPEITLAPGETNTTNFTAVYSITQVDIDNGSFTNQATAMGTAPDGTIVEDLSDDDVFIEDDPTVTILCQDASIALIKVGTVMDENNSGCADPKETIEYAFTVQNTGNVTLTNIDIEDPLVNVVGGPITLAPGETDIDSFTATYLITQANINDGFVENQATVNGLDPQQNVVSDLSDDDSFLEDDPTITPLCQDAIIALIKTGTLIDDNNNGCVDLGESIVYDFVVTNLGNVVLTNVMVTDPMVAVVGGPITLQAGQSDTETFSAEYIVTQDDVDNGNVTNQALVEGTTPDGNIVSDLSDNNSNFEDDPTVSTLCQDPKVSLEKEGIWLDDNGDGIPQPGETISYVFTVRNTGNVTLYNLTLEDTDLVGIEITGDPIPVLLAGEVDETTYSATYAINQDDIDNGEVVNQATITGETQNGTMVEDTSDDPNDLTNVDPDGDGDPDDPTVVILPNVLPELPFEIFNGITPDGDGLNDFFRVLGIENFPENNMKIYNRWGVLVWETDGYGGASGEENVFRGFSNGRATIQDDKILPTGTYFYILVRQDPDSGDTLKNTGYLYINR